jgi:hypothetical protein
MGITKGQLEILRGQVLMLADHIPKTEHVEAHIEMIENCFFILNEKAED